VTKAHAFRQGFAKRYLTNGAVPESLADLMGHTDVTVTKNSYSVFLTEELRRKHDRHVTLEPLFTV
jgi:site-specific recombinase XerD